MNRIPLSLAELNDILHKEQDEYDMARIVNPYACSTIDASGNHIVAQGTCHHVWQHDHRCSNCFSKRACIRGKTLYKTEVMGDKAYRIKTSPYLVLDEYGEERTLVIESIRVSPLSGEAVNGTVQQDMNSSTTDYVFNEAVTGVIHLNEDRDILFANRHARRMILRGGETEAFTLRTIVNNWLEGRQDSESPSLVFTQRYEYGHKDYFFDIQLIPFENNGKNELFMILHEHTDQEADAIAKMRDRDGMTGLYNEEGFRRAMRRLLEDHPDRHYMHLRLGVKNFTLVNSIFGISTGDAIIKRLGRLFADMSEESGCACRFHGDQFGVLMEREYFDREKLRLDLDHMKSGADSKDFTLLFRVGLCQIDDTSMEPELIIDRANLALRNVRDSGERVSFATFSNDMAAEVLTDNQLVARFEEAVLRDEFKMYLQPQTDAEGRLLGAEALTRWIREDGQVTPPDQFVPQLEKNGMICRMDCVVWEKAARRLAAWKGTPFKDICISVNVSPVDIAAIDVVQYFERLVEKYDIDPALLNVEITETAIINGPELLLRTVDKLHRRGFRVEIDDFGSGYSSLKMLKDLNADVLKIDREFLRHTVHERRVKLILSSIIRLARDLDMSVIAEGVENREMIDMLSEMGCHRFQGFYFSRPIPEKAFEEKYRGEMGA